MGYSRASRVWQSTYILSTRVSVVPFRARHSQMVRTICASLDHAAEATCVARRKAFFFCTFFFKHALKQHKRQQALYHMQFNHRQLSASTLQEVSCTKSTNVNVRCLFFAPSSLTPKQTGFLHSQSAASDITSCDLSQTGIWPDCQPTSHDKHNNVPLFSGVHTD